MEGVPVRVSDRCRPPKVAPPPGHVLERPARAARLAADAQYDFALETTVLHRLDEWKEARIRNKQERDERLRLAEEERSKERQLAVEAADAERKLQRMHLAEVTYPSTEDINDESSPVENSEPSVSSTPPLTVDAAPEIPATTSDGILRPTPVTMNVVTSRVNLLDDLDPVAKFQQSMFAKPNKFSHINGLYKKNVDKMTFSDFENDTSSPFDNLELKSINDIELLAQVLNTQPSNNLNLEQNVTVNGDTSHPVYQASNTYSSYGYSNNPYQNTLGDNYYNCDNKLPQSFNFNVNDTNNYYAPNYGYSSNALYQHVPNNYAVPNNNITPNDMKCDDSKMPTYNSTVENPYKYYLNYPPTYAQYSDVSNFQSDQIQTIDESAKNVPSDSSQSLLKSRSKSVPDIVKELDEELAEARLKSRERSHNCSPAPSRQIKLEPSTSQVTNIDKLPDPYDNLNPKLQSVCKSISNMGFPLDRVARACDDIGDDDKKVSFIYIIYFFYINIIKFKYIL